MHTHTYIKNYDSKITGPPNFLKEFFLCIRFRSTYYLMKIILTLVLSITYWSQKWLIQRSIAFVLRYQFRTLSIIFSIFYFYHQGLLKLLSLYYFIFLMKTILSYRFMNPTSFAWFHGLIKIDNLKLFILNNY